MKKFSTAAVILALVSVFTSLSAAQAAAGDKQCAFRSNAPDKHVVVKGDTLWGISGKFLERPWCWPKVWGMNREQIRNPHWIYPGQTVYFDRVAGVLRLGTPSVSGDVRLSPQIRLSDESSAIPSIASKDLEPFLTKAMIVEEQQLNTMPRIIATGESRVVLSAGDRAYVRGDLQGADLFRVYRPATAIKDPGTHKIIGYEAAHVGTVRLVRAAKATNEVHAFIVLDIAQEMNVGDYLVPMPPHTIVNYVPHPPETQIEARVASIYGGVINAGQNQAVVINRGKNQGIDVGTVLTLYRYGKVIKDRTNGNKAVKLPEEEYGKLFVFRVFDNVAYALIMEVREPVQIGDAAHTPE